jgi:S1-C subfamily serine protease
MSEKRSEPRGALWFGVAATLVGIAAIGGYVWLADAGPPDPIVSNSGNAASASGPSKPATNVAAAGPAAAAGLTPQAFGGGAGAAPVAQSAIVQADLAPPPPKPEKVLADTVRTEAGDGGQGLRLFPGRNRAAFAQLGLRPGDVVTAINGLSVAGQNWDDLMAAMKDSGSATVTVVRGGQPQQLELRAPD